MDKYTKLQKIGQGSFGAAYLCVRKHEPHGRRYVLKEIRMDPRDQQTALREATLLAALDHPNIIACRESFLASAHVLCIVTEFADGGDLRKHLTNRKTPYPDSDALDLFLQCCLALKHLHDRKIIHRDIKPENIFMTSSGVVKLGDFGVATVLSHTLACAQTLAGTPYYTSPEICQGLHYTNKTDVWSLGCVLYELATLNHAFTGRSQRQLFEHIVAGRYAPVPGPLGGLIADMLKTNPRDRPSINDLLQRPLLRDRIHRFLAQRAVADDLTHTVLHGQHILKPKAAPSPSPIRQSKPAAVRRNSLHKVKKVVSPPKPSPVRKKPPVPTSAAVPKARAAAMRPAPQPKPLVQRKTPDVARRHGGAIAKPPPMKVKEPTPAKAIEPTPPKANAPTPQSNVSDRVLAFNAQWQAQRQQILGNLASPGLPAPPPPLVKALVAVAPPPAPVPVQKPKDAPLIASRIVIQRGKKPSSVAALAAAKQREAMRRDIQQKKKIAAATPSPLDDPVILVQNLPEYTPPPLAPLPPPVPVAMDSGNDDESDDVNTPDSTVAAQANLEFQRMLLQLQRVVDEPPPSNEEDEEEDAVDATPPVVPMDQTTKDHELRDTTVLPPPPFDSNAVEKKPIVLSTEVLEDARFKAALKTALRSSGEPLEIESLSASETVTLAWLTQYIRQVL